MLHSQIPVPGNLQLKLSICKCLFLIVPFIGVTLIEPRTSVTVLHLCVYVCVCVCVCVYDCGHML